MRPGGEPGREPMKSAGERMRLPITSRQKELRKAAAARARGRYTQKCESCGERYPFGWFLKSPALPICVHCRQLGLFPPR